MLLQVWHIPFFVECRRVGRDWMTTQQLRYFGSSTVSRADLRKRGGALGFQVVQATIRGLIHLAVLSGVQQRMRHETRLTDFNG